MYRGVQWDLAYTLAKSEDTAPITSTLSVQGDTGGRSDPASLDTDRGPNILDQRHTFVGSIVAQPEVDAAGIAGAILNNNLFGIALQFASGIPVTLRSSRELNNDAIGADRPLGVTRNSYNLPARYNVDLRYSRRLPGGRPREAGGHGGSEEPVQHGTVGERDDDREHGRAGESRDRRRIAADAAGAGGDPA